MTIGGRIGVLMGGISSEREVSMNTGRGVLAALKEKSLDAVAIEWSEKSDLVDAIRREKITAAWIALHGTWGEDGCVQGLLECLRIPYTGSGVTASAIAMDKVISKRIFEDRGVRTAEWKLIPPKSDGRAEAQPLGFPVVIKPSREGSTVGITIVKEPGELAKALEIARACHGETLAERFIAGRELSVAVLDDAVLGTVEIRTPSVFYDYEAKYLRGDNEYLVPAPLDPKVEAAVKAEALRAHRALGCAGYSRVDLRLDEAGVGWVLEVNTLPGMTKTSLLPKIAKHAGLDYPALCQRILASARLHA